MVKAFSLSSFLYLLLTLHLLVPIFQPYVTELDLKMAILPQKSIDYLTECMPKTRVDGVEEGVYDYTAYIEEVS